MIENEIRPIRILHVVSTMDYGGVETLLMSIYRKIDRDRIQFDFLCHNRTESKYKEEIVSLGGRMFMVNGPHHGGVVKYIKELKKFFAEHKEYSIVHAHMNRDNAFVLSAAKRAHVRYRISHSHVAGGKYKTLYSIYVFFAKRVNNYCLTHRMACSVAAGIDLFGEKSDFVVVSNGINPELFRYDESLRNEIREEFGIKETTFVVGHVGRFDDAKNQAFAVKVFSYVCKTKPDSKLLLIGSGPYENSIKELVNKISLEDKVIFAGQHSNLQKYYSAMDAFIFPSKYEGFGIVAVESQCSGLPVLASDMVPVDVRITDHIEFEPLTTSCSVWAERIVEMSERTKDRLKYADQITNSNYNIDHTVQLLSDFYTGLINK